MPCQNLPKPETLEPIRPIIPAFDMCRPELDSSTSWNDTVPGQFAKSPQAHVTVERVASVILLVHVLSLRKQRLRQIAVCDECHAVVPKALCCELAFERLYLPGISVFAPWNRRLLSTSVAVVSLIPFHAYNIELFRQRQIPTQKQQPIPTKFALLLLPIACTLPVDV